MIAFDDIQKILDHFRVGRLISFEDFEPIYLAKTKQGTFYILQSTPFEARKTEKERLKILEGTAKIKTERLLRPDYTGKLNDDSSYAHYKDKYYSAYKLIKPKKKI